MFYISISQKLDMNFIIRESNFVSNWSFSDIYDFSVVTTTTQSAGMLYYIRYNICILYNNTLILVFYGGGEKSWIYTDTWQLLIQ